MWLRNLHLENWMLFREVDLEFDPDSRVIGVIGRYLDGEELDSERSNRSGKSSLVEAIRFLLYGVGRDRSQVKLINRSALEAGQSMKVQGTLVMGDGRELGIARGRSHKGEPWVEVQGHEGAGWKDANAYLESILGFTHDEFVHTCYFGQGDIHQFMAADPKAKRGLILGWLGQEKWVAREDYCTRQLHDSTIRAEAIRQSLAGIVDVGSVREHGAVAEKAEAAYRKTAEKVDTLRDKVAKLAEKLAKAREHAMLLERRDRIAAETKEVEGRLEKARVAAKVYKAAEALKKKATARRLEIVGRNLETRAPLISDQTVAATKGKELAKRLEQVKGTGGVCPVLGEACDRVGPEVGGNFGEELANLRKEFRMKTKELEGIDKETNSKLAVVDKSIAKQTAIMEANRTSDPKVYEDRLIELDPEMTAIQEAIPKRLVKPGVIEKKHQEAEHESQTALDARDELGQATTQAKARLERAQEVAAQKKKWKADLTNLEKRNAAWRYTKFMFGGRGIPGEHLRVAFSTMEQDINYILERLGVGIQVVFRPYRVTKQWESGCLVCGWEFPKGHGKKPCAECSAARQYKQQNALVLELTDTLEGQQSEFDLDSGGGQTLISFAVRLSLLLLKIREGHDDPPPVILDEVVGNLDAYHRQAILDLVLNVLPTDYGFEQIWWISHNEEVQSALESRLMVCRDGEKSTVEWA